jgi:DNA-binding NarL/FixJ family response regulator
VTVKARASRLLVKLDAGNRVQIALLLRDAVPQPGGGRERH